MHGSTSAGQSHEHARERRAVVDAEVSEDEGELFCNGVGTDSAALRDLVGALESREEEARCAIPRRAGSRHARERVLAAAIELPVLRGDRRPLERRVALVPCRALHGAGDGDLADEHAVAREAER